MRLRITNRRTDPTSQEEILAHGATRVMRHGLFRVANHLCGRGLRWLGERCAITGASLADMLRTHELRLYTKAGQTRQ